MAVTTVTIPAVAKTTIKRRIRIVTTRTVMGVEAVLEVIVAVAITVGVMGTEVEEVEVTIVTVPVEAMAEVYRKRVQMHTSKNAKYYI